MSAFAEESSLQHITLLSGEGVPFVISLKEAELSHFLRDVIHGNLLNTSLEIPLPNVTAPILELVVEYLHHYMIEPMHTIPQPIPWPKRLDDTVQKWYAAFCMCQDYATTFEIILASNYLDIPTLRSLFCARIARLIINKSPEEVMELFKVQGSVLSAEEYDALLHRNKWSIKTARLTEMEAEPEAVLSELKVYRQLCKSGVA